MSGYCRVYAEKGLEAVFTVGDAWVCSSSFGIREVVWPLSLEQTVDEKSADAYCCFDLRLVVSRGGGFSSICCGLWNGLIGVGISNIGLMMSAPQGGGAEELILDLCSEGERIRPIHSLDGCCRLTVVLWYCIQERRLFIVFSL